MSNHVDDTVETKGAEQGNDGKPGGDAKPVDVEVSIATEYEPLMAVGDNDLSLQTFVDNHVHLIEGDTTKFGELLEILGLAFGALVAANGVTT